MAIFTLNLRVRQARVDHVRQNKQRNHQRRGVDDIGVKEQERQRRGQEDQRGMPDKKWNMALT